jgi:hypothetical protein
MLSNLAASLALRSRAPITVLNPVPDSLGGNMAVALVQLLTTRNQTISGKTCLVNIVP